MSNQPDHNEEVLEMVTDTNQASELYELCKEVYELTGWIGTLQVIWNDQVTVVEPYVERWAQEEKYANYAPLYTSDYLLEKLPRYIYLQQSADGKSWGASQLQPTELRTAENAYQSINTSAVTPLKALLKLTLKLHEKGLL